MHLHNFLLLPSFPLLTNTITTASTQSCPPGVHIILTRGTNEVYGASVMEETATAVKDAIPGSDSIEVAYPATDDLVSQDNGYNAAESMITSYTSVCPSTPIVLMGFSQVRVIIGS
jgi:hypothetical protein